MIAAMNSWTCIESWPSKLRLVESIMFAFAVMAIVYVGAQ